VSPTRGSEGPVDLVVLMRVIRIFNFQKAFAVSDLYGQGSGAWR
jgi:hypothetical protein